MSGQEITRSGEDLTEGSFVLERLSESQLTSAVAYLTIGGVNGSFALWNSTLPPQWTGPWEF
jgi:hypothetical protein